MAALLTLAILCIIGYYTCWQIALCIWAVMFLHKITWHKEEMENIYMRIKNTIKGE